VAVTPPESPCIRHYFTNLHIHVKIVVGSDIIYTYTLLFVYIFYCSLYYSVDFFYLRFAPDGDRTEFETCIVE
jgi:hypothetical protein